ncbi:MAG: hypothetical protein GKR89_26415 [Candidatus Latescibacteria bacterium]|nr:hypothetical protein [Candidatus Latescibacterota bacterium]
MKALVGMLFFILGLLLIPGRTVSGQTLAEGIGLFEEGEFEAASSALHQALELGLNSQTERSTARKYLGLAHIVLGQEDQALAVYKEIVRDDASFNMDDLTMDGEAPPPEAERYLGQASMLVRQEDILARRAQLSRTSRSQALLRSSIFPGWGQRYQGYRNRGYFMLGLTAATIGYAVVADQQYRDAQDAYRGASDGAEFEGLYRDFRDKSNRAELAWGFVGAAWLLNMVDAAAQGPNITRPNLAVLGARGLQVVYSKRF